MNCDYSRCPHKDPFRKDHCREHYREYHNEDLIKRGMPKLDNSDKGKRNSKRSRKMPETVEEFLATRHYPNLSWWRCAKCVQRVNINTNKYMCPRCNLPCEDERVAWREKKKVLEDERVAHRESEIRDELQ
jgi:hypothetical protein